MDRSSVAQRVASRPGTLFHAASPAAVDFLLANGTLRTLRKGDFVFRDGDSAGWLYILAAGTVVTQLHGTSIRPLRAGDVGGLTSSLPLLTELNTGKPVGDEPLSAEPVGGRPVDSAGAPGVASVTSVTSRSASRRSMTHVVASDTAVIVQLSHIAYRRLLTEQPAFALHVMAWLHGRLRKKTAVIAMLSAAGRDEEDRGGGSAVGGAGGLDGEAQRAVRPDQAPLSLSPGGSAGRSNSDGGASAMAHHNTADLRVAVFDTKPYDRTYLVAAAKVAADGRSKLTAATSQTDAVAPPALSFKFFEAKLSRVTAALALGCGAVCIFVNDRCDAPVLQALDAVGVRLVLLRCAGFNNVDQAEARRLGIVVLRVPAYSPNAVAEHAFALLATVNRRTNRAYNRVRDGNFALSGLEGRDLNGRTAGVAGTGKIGRCFIRIAQGCGMRVVAWDKFLSESQARSLGVERVESISELAARSDVLSLHVPLTPETRHLINADIIGQMPRGAILINTSRGAIVDSAALTAALVAGHLGGAGLDVYEEEAGYFFEDCSGAPIRDDTLARLVGLPNVVVTSHQAFLTDKALGAIAATTVANACGFQSAVLVPAAERRGDAPPPAAPWAIAAQRLAKSVSKANVVVGLGTPSGTGKAKL